MRVLSLREREADLYREVAKARDRLMLVLATSPWAEFRAKTYSLERSFVRRALSGRQRREIARRFAGDRLDGAVNANAGRRQVLALLSRVERLGYSNLVHQHHIASILVRWTKESGEGAPVCERLLKGLVIRARQEGDAETRRRILDSASSKSALLKSSLLQRGSA